MNICKKKINNNEETYFILIYRLITQYIKCLFIIGSILFLIYIRKTLSNEITIGKLFAYILLSSLVLVIINLADQFAFNNILIGIAIYFGFELLKF